MTTTHVKDIMTRAVFAVAPETSLETAARLFTARHISGAPVVDKHGKAVGVITKTDLIDPDRQRSSTVGRSVYYCLGDSPCELDFEAGAIGEGIAADVMSPFVLSIPADASIEDAVRVIMFDHVHRLLVVRGARIVGIVTTTDLLRAYARQRARA